MPDNKNYPNPEEMSIDALLEETKMQIEAAPGEAGTMLDDTLMQNEKEAFTVSQHVEDAVPAQQQSDFTPDFGSAFSDYGTYDEPEEDAIPEDQEEYDEAYEDEEYPPYNDEDPLDPPKKPKRRTGKRFIPLFVKVLLYVVIVGLIAVGLGYGAWECAKDVLGFGRSEEEVSFIVNKGDTLDDVAERLKEQGIIKYPWLFKFYCTLTDSENEIEPKLDGDPYYTLRYNDDYHALIEKMQNKDKREEARITIPEGYTCAQIFAIIEEKGVCTVAELEQCAAEYEFDYWFLEGIPYGQANRLEGFLFPDTYDFYENDDPERVLDKFLSNFNDKFSENHQKQLEELNDRLAARLRSVGYGDDYIQAHRLTVYELMIVASMVEKEAAKLDIRGDITSVIYNRLCNPANYPYLNIDATVIYALGGNVQLPLTNADTQVDSPYNTYKVIGLPAGPIGNPGMSSISAALNPTDTEYYYYALDVENECHHFSKTKQEHDAFVEGQNYGG